MSKSMRRPSPATIIACIALFVSLGGTGYSAIVLPKNSVGATQIRKGAVTSGEVRNGTIRGRDVHTGTLGPREIAESKLGPVPHALLADTLGGLSLSQVKDQVRDRCPVGTIYAAATCIEELPRPAESFGLANNTCELASRALPTYAELIAFYHLQRPVAPGGELTSNVGESRTTAGQLDATVILTNTGSNVEYINATGNTQRGFRCKQAPTNN